MSVDGEAPEALVSELLGDPGEPMPAVEARVAGRMPGQQVIVWEGDASTFQFTYVSRSAEAILGYPCARWTSEPTFWADLVVAPMDRADAVAYCALATVKRRHHVFDYRAISADGRTVWLRDLVQVIVGPRGVAERLRGAMIDISAERSARGTFLAGPEERRPSRDELER